LYIPAEMFTSYGLTRCTLPSAYDGGPDRGREDTWKSLLAALAPCGATTRLESAATTMTVAVKRRRFNKDFFLGRVRTVRGPLNRRQDRIAPSMVLQ
jgi:hypothetical protein